MIGTNIKQKASSAEKSGPSPVVIAGPSGVGKGTLVGLLMKRHPRLFGFSVSHTTRGPRPGEENGVHYNFVEKSVMEKAIENNEFIEYANVHTNIYGTSIAAVEKVRSQGKICILDIDIQGVKNVKNSELNCKYVFISPPSMEILETRLRSRGTEKEDKIKIRMNTAISEMHYGHQPGNFDAIIVNTDIDVALDELIVLMRKWFPEQDFSIEKTV